MTAGAWFPGSRKESKLYVISYNAAISACEKSEQWQQALGLLSEGPYKALSGPYEAL